MLFDNVKYKFKKRDIDYISIFQTESNLNYNYIITLNILFEKTKVIIKESKIYICYKLILCFIFNSQLGPQK